ESHHHVVCFRAGVDRPSHLWHPKRNVVMSEYRERESELVSVERALRLADHYGIESPVPSEVIKETIRFGSAFPRNRATLGHVEVLGHDDTARWLDQLMAAMELPLLG